MRRLARPTGLSRGLTQPPQHSQRQEEQRRHIRTRKPLSKHPKGLLIRQGSKPLKNRFPAFELPDLVLDLDAEGSRHVRPYDAFRDAPLQESQWGYDPVVDEVREDANLMYHPMRRDLRKLNSATLAPFSGERLSDLDIMAVALMDQSSNLDSNDERPAQRLDTKIRPASKLQDDLDQNGIPRAIGRDAIKIIPFMLHRKQLALEALKDPSKRDPSSANDERGLDIGIANCKDLTQLKRLCSRIARPESGIEFSAASIDHVHARLLKFLRSREEGSTSADILKFVNNLTINRLSANKELNRSMTLFGLQLASELGLLSCILQYLHICLFTGFITSRDDNIALTRSHVGSALLVALQRGECTARGSRQQIFTLITGRGPDDVAPTPCLFGLVAQDHALRPEIFELSVRLLGELGALRLLVHHWRKRVQNMGASGQSMESGRQQGHETHQADEVFVEAFQRCAQVLGSVKADDVSVDLTTVTGDVEKAARLDLQNINAVDFIHARRGSEIPKPSLDSMGKSFSVEDVKDAFNKSDLRTSMGHFQKLIEKAMGDVEGI
ncbi:hypothetical protein N0V82_005285 [Gnomoniopsis sp. IMI 355080]|nr:hypothetical protein N0V82_005285 [Gnomoniopsis sp. IMI 355080]